MARTSRVHKEGRPRGTEPEKISTGKVYHVALYVRLSILDGGHKDSDTAETQELLLRHFIEGKPYFSLFSVYTDNGKSGVNFERSGFERMMEDVKRGLVNCIIVKDLSRFGRNYIEAGEYLEKVFPFLGVRFIAVNDGIDTDDPASFDSLSLHLKNLVNEMYARDISAKISTVLRGKQERGEFIGTLAAYGYQKSEKDKHKLVIDEKTAPVVRDIFSWRLAGFSYGDIIRRLAAQGIPSPCQYRYMTGSIYNERLSNVPWRIGTVRRIVANPVYLGHTVQGKSRESLSQGQKRKYFPEEEWIIVKNTHEAIIDPSVFNQVQQINLIKKQKKNAQRKRFPEVERTEDILKSLVCCGSCGRRLMRHRNIWENKYKTPRIHVEYRYLCPRHEFELRSCSFQGICEGELQTAVFEAIRVQVQLAENMKKIISSQKKNSMEQEKAQIELQLQRVMEGLEKIKRHKASLYDNYADGLMNEQDYIYAQSRYQEKEVMLQKHILELNISLESYHKEGLGENPWIKNMLHFRDATELTREMVLTLVEKVTVYNDMALQVTFRFQDDFCRLQKNLLEGGKGDE